MVKNIKTNLFQKISLVFFGILITLVLLEIILRLAGWIVISAQDANNAASFDKSEYRIMCIGESTTQGDIVPVRNNFPYELEVLLNLSSDTRKFTVINKGLPGKTSTELLETLEGSLVKYKPQMVIMMVGINDALFDRVLSQSSFSKFKYLYLKKLRVYKFLKLMQEHIQSRLSENKNSDMTYKGLGVEKQKGFSPKEIYHYLDTGQTEAFDNWTYRHQDDPDVSFIPKPGCVIDENQDTCFNNPDRDELKRFAYWRELKTYHPLTIENYNKMAGLILDRGIKLICMQYPRRDIEPLKDIVKRKNEVVFVSNQENFEKVLTEENYWEYFKDKFARNFGHCTIKGNRLIAQNLYDVLIEQLKMPREGVH